VGGILALFPDPTFVAVQYATKDRRSMGKGLGVSTY